MYTYIQEAITSAENQAKNPNFTPSDVLQALKYANFPTALNVQKVITPHEGFFDDIKNIGDKDWLISVDKLIWSFLDNWSYPQNHSAHIFKYNNPLRHIKDKLLLSYTWIVHKYRDIDIVSVVISATSENTNKHIVLAVFDVISRAIEKPKLDICFMYHFINETAISSTSHFKDQILHKSKVLFFKMDKDLLIDMRDLVKNNKSKHFYSHYFNLSIKEKNAANMFLNVDWLTIMYGALAPMTTEFANYIGDNYSHSSNNSSSLEFKPIKLMISDVLDKPQNIEHIVHPDLWKTGRSPSSWMWNLLNKKQIKLLSKEIKHNAAHLNVKIEIEVGNPLATVWREKLDNLGIDYDKFSDILSPSNIKTFECDIDMSNHLLDNANYVIMCPKQWSYLGVDEQSFKKSVLVGGSDYPLADWILWSSKYAITSAQHKKALQFMTNLLNKQLQEITKTTPKKLHLKELFTLKNQINTTIAGLFDFDTTLYSKLNENPLVSAISLNEKVMSDDFWENATGYFTPSDIEIVYQQVGRTFNIHLKSISGNKSKSLAAKQKQNDDFWSKLLSSN